MTEQTFSVAISASSDAQYFAATELKINNTKEYDFVLSNGNGPYVVEFPPDVHEFPINVTIIDDEIAEGIETFFMHSQNYRGSPNYYYPNGIYADSTVILHDNDGKLNPWTTLMSLDNNLETNKSAPNINFRCPGSYCSFSLHQPNFRSCCKVIHHIMINIIFDHMIIYL